jgi:predicted  nucleic acid-binding Zn-ribbon protein
MQLQHKSRTLPARAQLAEVQTKLPVAADAAALLGAQLDDLEREIARIEAEIEQVRNRVTKDRDLLEGGNVTAQVLENLQHELETLARRQGELEEGELEVLEQAETLGSQRAAALAIEAELIAERDEIQQQIDAAVAEIDADKNEVATQRTALVVGLPADLVALYDKISADIGAAGAAKMQHRRCQGCQMELVPTEINRIRDAAEDEVLRCEECRRILIRTAESGL